MSSSAPAAAASRRNSLLGSLVFFDWWIRLQRRVEGLTSTQRRSVLGIAIALGVAARMWAQSLPGNWDFGQWVNVSNAALAGVDPYATYGYNYPPPWLAVLTGFQAAATDDAQFRLMIAMLLTLTDVGIFLLLVRRGYLLAGVLFILSPISIAISGQHQQVESIALFLAFAGALMLSGRSQRPISGVDWVAALLIGLSLAFKPVFLLFPLWLLIRRGPLARRLLLGAVPFAVLGVSVLAAFLAYPPAEVIQRIFGHGGTNNAPLINVLVPNQLAPWVIEVGGPKVIFVVLLLLSAWLFRSLDVFEMSLAYTVGAVLFAWAMANQYLLTPMAAVAVYLNIGFMVWLLLSTIYLGGAADILNVWGLREIQPHIMLDWTKVFQDLFPWFLIGWVVMVIGMLKYRDNQKQNGVSSMRSSDVAD